MAQKKEGSTWRVHLEHVLQNDLACSRVLMERPTTSFGLGGITYAMCPTPQGMGQTHRGGLNAFSRRRARERLGALRAVAPGSLLEPLFLQCPPQAVAPSCLLSGYMWGFGISEDVPGSGKSYAKAPKELGRCWLCLGSRGVSFSARTWGITKLPLMKICPSPSRRPYSACPSAPPHLMGALCLDWRGSVAVGPEGIALAEHHGSGGPPLDCLSPHNLEAIV